VVDLLALIALLSPELRKAVGKAIGQLVTGAVGIPAAHLKAKTAIVEAEGEANAIILKRVAVATGEKLAADPELVERMASRFASGMVAKQENVEAVARIAIEEVRSNPSVPSPNAEISTRWLSHFAAVAEIQTDQCMQLYFGKVLAGEIIRPGRFDPATLNVLSMMSAATASDFSKLCQMAIEMGDRHYVLIHADPVPRKSGEYNRLDPSAWVKGEQLREFGLSHQSLLRLRSAGLLASLPEEEYPLLSDYCDGRPLKMANAIVRLDGQRHLEAKAGEFRPNAISLAPAGEELRLILSIDPDEAYLSALERMLQTAGVTLTRVRSD